MNTKYWFYTIFTDGKERFDLPVSGEYETEQEAQAKSDAALEAVRASEPNKKHDAMVFVSE